MNQVIDIQNLSKKYFIGGNKEYSIRGTISNFFKKENPREFWALKDVSLQINKGETIGIIGRNGSGKSTLLKILSKVTHPTTGKITMTGRVSSLLEVGTGFHPELTGRENIYFNGALLGMRRNEITSKIDEIIAFSEIENFIDTAVKRYSSGMYVRLAFAIAAHLNSDILLLDEVLAVGDEKFQQKCMGKMSKVTQDEGRTILFVSHDLHAIKKICKQSIYLDGGNLVEKGKTDDIISLYRGRSFDQTFKNYMSGPLKSISIANSDMLMLKAEYLFNKKNNINIPYLRFEIKNEFGQTILAGDPTLEGIKSDKKEYLHQGSIQINISNPKLISGRYDVAIKFGNGYEIMVEDDNALHFEIEKNCKYSEISAIESTINYKFC